MSISFNDLKEKMPVDEAMDIYRKIIQFLTNLGALLYHIKPELLLNYSQYQEALKTVIKSHRPLLSYNEFYLLSKQAWLDLLLQMYKVIIYKRMFKIMTDPAVSDRKRSAVTLQETIKSCVTLKAINDNIYSTEDTLLLNWLCEHLRKQKVFLTSLICSGSTNQSDILSKTITNFTADLIDGLAFACVTVSYCPFTTKYLKGLYVPPNNLEECIHNASLIINIWHELHINYDINYKDIINPNGIQMLLFISYLFEFLTSLQPRDTIKFSCDLATSQNHKLTINNDNISMIKYDVFLFDNKNKAFRINQERIHIAPEMYFHLDIYFKAKFLQVERSILILSGEIAGNRYTCNKSFVLEGFPTLYNPTSTIVLESKTYKVMSMTRDIKSPYPGVGEYALSVTYEKPSKMETLKLIPYKIVRESKGLARLRLNRDTFRSDKHGIIKCNGVMCSVTINNNEMWLFFSSQELGIFFVKVVIESIMSSVSSNLHVILDRQIMTRKCTCPSSTPELYSGCPRVVSIEIPNRNAKMWRTVINYYLQQKHYDEAAFWQKYRNTSIEVHVLRHILNENKDFITPEMSYIFKKTSDFNVVVKHEYNIVAQSKLHIDNTFASEQYTRLYVHFDENVEAFAVKLLSADGKELRIYKVIIGYI